MEKKKTPKADLENKKVIFMEIGLVVVLAIILAAFEWSTKDVSNEKFDMIEEAAAEEDITPITRPEEVKPPPPPPPPKVADVLNIVEDDVEIDEELDIEDQDIDEDTEVNFENIEEDQEEEEEAVFFIVEDMPKFPGGPAALRKYLKKTVEYPIIAQENGIQGRVFVKFVVGKDGSVTNVEISRGADPSLDKEAIRVVKAMPKWEPGRQRGKAVRVSYTVPINFQLQ